MRARFDCVCVYMRMSVIEEVYSHIYLWKISTCHFFLLYTHSLIQPPRICLFIFVIFLCLLMSMVVAFPSMAIAIYWKFDRYHVPIEIHNKNNKNNQKSFTKPNNECVSSILFTAYTYK